MSNDENPNESVNESKATETSPAEEVSNSNETAKNAISTIMALKDSNPKVFFGGIGGVVLLVLIVVMMSGGSGSKHLPASKVMNLSMGQTYTLKGINSYDAMATIRLVAVPGSIAAYDDSKDKDNDSSCKNIAEGTKVRLIQVQDTGGMGKSAEIEVVSGDCSGRKGWTNVTNLN